MVDNDGQVPFAGDQEYLNVCEIVDMSKILIMTEFEDYHQGLELLDNNKYTNITIDKILSQYQIRSNYSVLWLTTKELSSHNPVQWNAIFRRLGIDGFIDYETGTIHPSEPTQGVVFRKESLKTLHVIHRSRYLRGLDLRKDPNKIFEIQSPTERQQLILVRTNPEFIKFLINPCKKAQIIAVKKDPTVIRHITGPDDDISLLAINANPSVIIDLPFLDAVRLLKLADSNILKSIDEDDITYMLHNMYKGAKGSSLAMQRVTDAGIEFVKYLGDKITDDIVLNLLLRTAYPSNMADVLGINNLLKLSRSEAAYLIDRKGSTMEKIFTPDLLRSLHARPKYQKFNRQLEDNS